MNYTSEGKIITPHLLRDQAKLLRERAQAMMLDAMYTDSSQARIVIEEGAADLRRQASVKDAEAEAMERTS